MTLAFTSSVAVASGCSGCGCTDCREVVGESSEVIGYNAVLRIDALLATSHEARQALIAVGLYLLTPENLDDDV